MSNQLFHNKWHGYNHYTVPLTGFPDSATDPIASEAYPFRGTFFNEIRGDFGSKVASITINDPGSGYSLEPTLILSGNPALGFSIYITPKFKVNVDTVTKTITSIDVIESGRFNTPAALLLKPDINDTITKTARVSLSSLDYTLNSDSLNWGYYSSITYANSAYFELYPSVLQTSVRYLFDWFRGYVGFTNSVANSGKWESVFNLVSSVSSSEKFVGLSLKEPASGRPSSNDINVPSSQFTSLGWHVALSSTSHWLDRPKQVNIKQKVAKPVYLNENSNRTINWNTTAQTVHFTLTGNYPLTASEIFNAKRGGKYTMWLYIDYCPEENMDFTFDSKYYNVVLKKYNEDLKRDEYIYDSNTLQLSATSITRVDFVYDGTKMLGRATHYRSFLKTEKDLYFQGTGLTFYDTNNIAREKNPVYISSALDGIGEHFTIIDGEFNVIGDNFEDSFPNNTGIWIDSPYINFPNNPEPFRSDFDANSSLYVAGSGISIRYLGANLQYFNFNTINASFPTENILSKFISLTSSFDRVIAYLSAGSWLLPQYAGNLVASPDSSLVTDTISAAFPQPPWEFTSANFKSVNQCLSTLIIDVFSSKDRDIEDVIVNNNRINLTPIVVDGMYQPYNFNNERQGRLTFNRVQQDYNIEVFFTNQPILTIPGMFISIGSLNEFTIRLSSSKIIRWSSNLEEPTFSLIQDNASLAPTLSTYKALRFASFNNNTMQSETPLTMLSSSNGKFFKGFTTFTVFKVKNFPVRSFVWWLGDYTNTTEQKGYGLVLSGSSSTGNTGRVYTVSNYEEFGKRIGSSTDSINISANQIVVVATTYDSENKGFLKQNVFVDGKLSITTRTINFAKFENDQTNFNLVLGKHPNSNNNYGNVDLYDLFFYDRALSNTEIITINSYLVSKYSGYRLV